VRLLASATSRRLAVLPEVPTLKESGVDVAADGWFALFAPGGLPAGISESLHAHLALANQDPELRRLLATAGAEPANVPPAELAMLVRRAYEHWGAVIRTLGLRQD
jgi:tripartite-type tricarboxylate transporter receptor subunit TctC